MSISQSKIYGRKCEITRSKSKNLQKFKEHSGSKGKKEKYLSKYEQSAS